MTEPWSDPVREMCRDFNDLVERRKMSSSEREIAFGLFFDGAYRCARANYLFVECELHRFRMTMTTEQVADVK